MSEILQLNHQSENTYEFTLDVDGITSSEIRAWFIIKTASLELSFPCTQDNKEFKCIIPAIPYIERSTYTACIRITANGFFFEPVTDLLVNVVGNLNLETGSVKEVKLTPKVKPKFDNMKEFSKKKEVKTKSKEKKKVSESIANNILNEFDNGLMIEEIDNDTSTIDLNKDAKVKSILEGYTSRKTSVKNTQKFIRKS